MVKFRTYQNSEILDLYLQLNYLLWYVSLLALILFDITREFQAKFENMVGTATNFKIKD